MASIPDDISLDPPSSPPAAAPSGTAANKFGSKQSASINQSPSRTPLEGVRCAVPDFRNMGAILRLLLVVNVLVVVTALLRMHSFETFSREFVAIAAHVQIPLAVAAAAVYFLGPWLIHLTWRELTAMLCSLAVLFSTLTQALVWPAADSGEHLRQLLWAVGAALCVTVYFRWRQIEQIPALGEARIIALTARIRPHFFFNSLNGVLGVMRSDPKRAELALESLAELFRELMKENRDLVTLCDEIELCNRYLDLERLRLGERLQVRWELKYAPLNARVPPLMLQPLIENAVYHGIEPNPEPGVISVKIVRKGHALEMVMSNPACAQARRSTGNKMAINNIRERLALFFDVEAALTMEEKDGVFRVRIRMPLRVAEEKPRV